MVWGKGVLGSCSSEHVFRTEGVVDAWVKEPAGEKFSFDLVGMRDREWRDRFEDDDNDDDDDDAW